MLKRKVAYVNCDGSRDLQLMCSRNAVRSFPWVVSIQDDMIYALGKQATVDELANFSYQIEQNTFEKKGNNYSRKWFTEHRTKYADDGHPLEFPIKPDVESLEERLSMLEKKFDSMQKSM